jgi:hypothetical protein
MVVLDSTRLGFAAAKQPGDTKCSTHMRLMSNCSVLDAVRGIGSSMSIPAQLQHPNVNLVLI